VGRARAGLHVICTEMHDSAPPSIASSSAAVVAKATPGNLPANTWPWTTTSWPPPSARAKAASLKIARARPPPAPLPSYAPLFRRAQRPRPSVATSASAKKADVLRQRAAKKKC